MAKAPFNAPATSWKPLLAKRAEESAKNAQPAEAEYSEYEALVRMNKLFEKTMTANMMSDNKLCTRATENGPCGHAKLKLDMYCEVHKNFGLFAATGYTEYTFSNHPRVENDVTTRLTALKPSV